jgi:AraC-like DNA-binding protein
VESQLALTTDQILAMRPLYSQIRVQSRALIDMFESDTRLSAAFATQQRWLMSHVGLAMYFRSVTEGRSPGINISHFIDKVHENSIASRNTCDSYVKELIKYKYLVQTADPTDKRLRPLVPSVSVIQAIGGWLEVHLASLDRLTDGQRLATFRQHPDLLAYTQPPIANGLVNTRAVRTPDATFSLFTWLDNGGLVMDWLITSMPDLPPETERVPVGRLSVADMAAKLSLSRTHLARKLKEAEDLGSIGWEGRRGHSVMWVSSGFRQEYAKAQAIKLSIIDHAFETAATRLAE